MRPLALVVLLVATAVAAPHGPATATDPPLAGKVVVIDAGHQWGNASHPREIARLVPDGHGGRKPCNTTGTATNGGYAEARFTWGVARRLRIRLERQGATVIMTRTSSSRRLWGPCVDVRGKIGNRGIRGLKKNADLKISIHGDGSTQAGAHGFHLIIHPTHAPKRTRSFARNVRAALVDAGFARSTYTGGSSRIVQRTDLATINYSRMPTVMAELGNMRNHGDAGVMRSASGQIRYARALETAVLAQLR